MKDLPAIAPPRAGRKAYARTTQAARVAALVHRLHRGRRLTRRGIMDRYGVSRATAARDLRVIEDALPVTRDQGAMRLRGDP